MQFIGIILLWVDITNWYWVMMRKLALKKDSFHVRSQQSFSMSYPNEIDDSGMQSIDTTVFVNNDFNFIMHDLMKEERRSSLGRKTQTNYLKPQCKLSLKTSQVIGNQQSIVIPQKIKRLVLNRTRCLSLGDNDMIDSIYGAFFGFVIGDSIGAHIAYQTTDLSAAISTALLMNGGGTYNLGSGQGTDETQILLSASYGLIQSGQKYSQLKMGESYLKWVDSKPFDLPVLMVLSINQMRRYKQTTNKLNDRILLDKILSSSTKNQKHQSNLGLVRIIPLTVYGLKLSDHQFIKLVKDQMQIICPNQLVIQTAIVYAKLLRVIFQTRDTSKAFYEASKWVYENGNQQLLSLWQFIQRGVLVPSKGNMGKLKTSFTYALIQFTQQKVDFYESLLNTLLKGGDTDSNCAIVMGLIGAITGYNGIPSYFRNKIINSSMKNTPRPRLQQFQTNKILEIIPKLLEITPKSYHSNIHHQYYN